jgi:hypothetical protein
VSDASDYSTYLREVVRLAVAGGYDSRDRIIESATELLEYDPAATTLLGELADTPRAYVGGLVDAALDEHRNAERSFPATTDCDRLAMAFERLRGAGVLAAEDVGYTSSDVRDEMWSALDDAARSGSPARGWVAFHRQDVERAVDSGLLYIAYAAASDRDEDFVGIADEAAQALRNAGLNVTWEGDPSKRIEIHGMTWQRRRHPRRRRQLSRDDVS